MAAGITQFQHPVLNKFSLHGGKPRLHVRPSRVTRNVSHIRVDRRSEEHTSELQSPVHPVCRPLLEKKKPALPTSTAPPPSSPTCCRSRTSPTATSAAGRCVMPIPSPIWVCPV